MNQKKIISLLIFSFMLMVQPISAIESIETPAQSFLTVDQLALFKMEALGPITASEFASISPSQYYHRTGEKMKFKNRFVLKLTQKALKKQQKKGEAFNFEDASYDFSIGGFLLGFFLGLLGVVLALLLFPKNVFKSSLVGLLCLVIVLVVGVLVV